jgi:hypothetical protein
MSSRVTAVWIDVGADGSANKKALKSRNGRLFRSFYHEPPGCRNLVLALTEVYCVGGPHLITKQIGLERPPRVEMLLFGHLERDMNGRDSG